MTGIVIPLRPVKPACSFCLKAGRYMVRSQHGTPPAQICTDCAVDVIKVIREAQDEVPPGTPLAGIAEMEPRH